MKLTTELFTLCDHAIVSQDSKLSLIGLFSQIFVPRLPVRFPQFHSVAILAGEPEAAFKLSLTITSPDSRVVYRQLINLKLGVHGRANLISKITNLNISTTGIYNITIKSNTNPIITKTFEVIKITPAKSDTYGYN